jgi:hypothetical protein
VKSIQIGQLEVTAICDLVAVKHREPRMHDATHTFTGSFDSKEHWTQMTPEYARRLAAALTEVADQLDAFEAAKASPVALHQGNSHD